jgi:hypothetical protein
MKTGNKAIEMAHAHDLTETELLTEANRLEKLLQRGELTEKESRRLLKIRGALWKLAVVKDGW